MGAGPVSQAAPSLEPPEGHQAPGFPGTWLVWARWVPRPGKLQSWAHPSDVCPASWVGSLGPALELLSHLPGPGWGGVSNPNPNPNPPGGRLEPQPHNLPGEVLAHPPSARFPFTLHHLEQSLGSGLLENIGRVLLLLPASGGAGSPACGWGTPTSALVPGPLCLHSILPLLARTKPGDWGPPHPG